MKELRILNEFRMFLVRGFSICIITAVPSTILLVLYFITSPMIAEYHEMKLKKSVLDVFNVPYLVEEKQLFGFKYNKFDKEDVRKVFNANITIEDFPHKFTTDRTESENDNKLFMYYKDKRLQGLGFVVTKFGYGFNKAAEISIFICVAPDLETIKGIEILDHTETPGLGGRMTEDEFKMQFVGKKLSPKLSVVRGRETLGPNEVHAITGASYTSKGIEKMINEAMENFWKEMGANKG